MTENAVEIKGLSKKFGEIVAVESIDLVIRKGEMFGMVGPDGAGKTTTIRMLCGITEPSAGSASLLGHDLAADLEEAKRHIGYLSQRFSLYGDLTVDENIEFFAEINEVKDYKPRREQLLEFTRLTPFRKRLAEKLSGGMKQKLALACTLVHTPEIILLDEPTTGVDPVSRRDFWKILSDLLKSGITIVMTTPYLDEAERCSRVALINKGKLMVVDHPANVKKLMKGVVIEIVCDQIRKAAAALKGLPGISEVQAMGDRLNIVVGDREKDFRTATEALTQQGIGILDSRVIPASLENVFISMMKEA
jgi:ABC-2 type transport system ATP-binding protein